MFIANPMYDAAFKFLIEDNECAKLLLGEIIQQEILECELLHNEIPIEGASENNSGVLRMDFKAKVKMKGGKHLLVIIEVQKTHRETNPLRFRQYLGSQYSNKNNSYLAGTRRTPYPIFSIYILGYNIGIDDGIPIIKVSPQNFDYTLNTEIAGTCTFIESLSHNMIIIQTPALKNQKRSLLEKFLSNFLPSEGPILEIKWQEFDPKYVSLLRRLQDATMKKEIVELMQRENVLQEEWDTLHKEREEALKGRVEALKEREEALIREKETLKISIAAFLELGLPKEEIASKFSISLEQLENIIS